MVLPTCKFACTGPTQTYSTVSAKTPADSLDDCIGTTPNIHKAFAQPPPPEMQMCVCGKSFAELGEAAMRRMQAEDADHQGDVDASPAGRDGVTDASGESNGNTSPGFGFPSAAMIRKESDGARGQ
jgi:hypothetical protein